MSQCVKDPSLTSGPPGCLAKPLPPELPEDPSLFSLKTPESRAGPGAPAGAEWMLAEWMREGGGRIAWVHGGGSLRGAGTLISVLLCCQGPAHLDTEVVNEERERGGYSLCP